MYGLSLELVEACPSVLHVRGDIDIANADEFAAALKDALSADSTLVVDMAELTFIDVAGLRVILRTAEARNGNGPLTLLNAPRIAWMLELVGLEETASIDIRRGN